MGIVVKWIMAKFHSRKHCKNCIYFYIDKDYLVPITGNNLMKKYKEKIENTALGYIVENKHEFLDWPLCGLVTKFSIYGKGRGIKFSKLVPCKIKNQKHNCRDYKEIDYGKS